MIRYHDPGVFRWEFSQDANENGIQWGASDKREFDQELSIQSQEIQSVCFSLKPRIVGCLGPEEFLEHETLSAHIAHVVGICWSCFILELKFFLNDSMLSNT
jgi:hypothetical protein